MATQRSVVRVRSRIQLRVRFSSNRAAPVLRMIAPSCRDGTKYPLVRRGSMDDQCAALFREITMTRSIAILAAILIAAPVGGTWWMTRPDGDQFAQCRESN